MLPSRDKQLKALGQGLAGRHSLGKRRDLNGVLRDKGGLDELVLHKGVKGLGMRISPLLCGVLDLRCRALRQSSLACSSVVAALKSTPAVLLDGVSHGDAAPGRRARSMSCPVIGDFGGAQHLEGDGAKSDLLDKLHHAVVIGIGLIELDGGKFRVVLGCPCPRCGKCGRFHRPFPSPPTIRRLRCSSVAMRRYMSMSSVLWWVMNGRACGAARA